MIKYERSNRQAPSNSLLPLEECIDELLVLLRVNLVVLEQLVKGLAVLSGQCLGLLLGLGLHLLQKSVENLLILLVEEDFLVTLGFVIERSAGKGEVANGNHGLACSYCNCSSSLSDQALHILSYNIIIYYTALKHS